MLVTVLSLLVPLKPKLFYWTNLLVFYFKSTFYSQTQKIYKQMFIQTCFKPLIVLFNVIIDIPPCNNCVIQFLSCKAIINKLLIYKWLATTISGVSWSCIMLRGQSVVPIAYLEEKPLLKLLSLCLLPLHVLTLRPWTVTGIYFLPTILL